MDEGRHILAVMLLAHIIRERGKVIYESMREEKKKKKRSCLSSSEAVYMT